MFDELRKGEKIVFTMGDLTFKLCPEDKAVRIECFLDYELQFTKRVTTRWELEQYVR